MRTLSATAITLFLLFILNLSQLACVSSKSTEPESNRGYQQEHFGVSSGAQYCLEGIDPSKYAFNEKVGLANFKTVEAVRPEDKRPRLKGSLSLWTPFVTLLRVNRDSYNTWEWNVKLHRADDLEAAFVKATIPAIEGGKTVYNEHLMYVRNGPGCIFTTLPIPKGTQIVWQFQPAKVQPATPSLKRGLDKTISSARLAKRHIHGSMRI